MFTRLQVNSICDSNLTIYVRNTSNTIQLFFKYTRWFTLATLQIQYDYSHSNEIHLKLTFVYNYQLLINFELQTFSIRNQALSHMHWRMRWWDYTQSINCSFVHKAKKGCHVRIHNRTLIFYKELDFLSKRFVVRNWLTADNYKQMFILLNLHLVTVLCDHISMFHWKVNLDRFNCIFKE
jgi:hypothetical protein